jgi:hypothetical protein
VKLKIAQIQGIRTRFPHPGDMAAIACPQAYVMLIADMHS